MKLKTSLIAIALLCLAATAFAQGGAANRGTAEATVKGKKISINYGRPSLQGRDMLGKAPTGTIWRLGMNQATEIDTAADLKIGDTVVKAGKYSLWAKKTSDTTWVLAFHPKTGIWGLPVMKEGFVAELPLKMTTGSESVEQFTITLADNKGKGAFKAQWGTAVLSGDFGVQ